jgi:hypothetical protein
VLTKGYEDHQQTSLSDIGWAMSVRIMVDLVRATSLGTLMPFSLSMHKTAQSTGSGQIFKHFSHKWQKEGVKWAISKTEFSDMATGLLCPHQGQPSRGHITWPSSFS